MTATFRGVAQAVAVMPAPTRSKARPRPKAEFAMVDAAQDPLKSSGKLAVWHE